MERCAQEHVKIDEKLDEKENRILEEYMRVGYNKLGSFSLAYMIL